MDNNDDYLFQIELRHVTLERNGDERRDRSIPLTFGGMPTVVDTRYDGMRTMILGQPPLLRSTMIEPMRLLQRIQSNSLDRLGKAPWRRAHVLAAAVAEERLIRNMVPRAEVCRGSVYLLKSVVQIIGHTSHAIAVDPRSCAALAADDHLAEAAARIEVLIASARCQG